MMKSQRPKTAGMSLPTCLVGAARGVLLLVLALAPLVSLAQNAMRPAAGDGSSDNPFIVSSAENLAWFRDYVNGTYTPEEGSAAEPHPAVCAKLAADIDMSTVCHPAGEADGSAELSWVPISTSELAESWHGVFDGDGHVISNLYINNTAEDTDGQIHACGLFGVIGVVGESSTVKNVVFRNVNINSTASYLGTVAGISERSEISGITIESGSVKGFCQYGGILGMAYSGIIESCINHAVINTKHTQNMKNSFSAGGIMGACQATKVLGCLNYGLIDVASYIVGGICGYMQYNTNVEMCANYADVAGAYFVGGAAGLSERTTLDRVLTVGNVSSEQDDDKLGLVVGTVLDDLHGFSFYNNEARLAVGGEDIDAKVIGNSTSDIFMRSKGFTRKMLKSGYLAYYLNLIKYGDWGQRIGVDQYPVPGSTDIVYSDGYTEIRCDGTVKGKLTNEKPTKESRAVLTHTYDYAKGACTECGTEIPVLDAVTTGVKLMPVRSATNSPSGYNLFRFVPSVDGELTVYTSGSSDTYGTIWNSDCTEILAEGDNNEETGDENFKIRCLVEKDKLYYIGVRDFGGNAIDSDCFITRSILPHKDEYTLADGTPWQGENMLVKKLTYTRIFNNTEWQPLYVPFAISSADWKAQGLEMACINNFHEYELEDGSSKVVLEVNRVSSGRLHPNTPYLIRANETGDKAVTLSDVELVEAVSNAIGCSSVTRSYTFTGIYEEKDDLDTDNDYVLSGGSMYHSDGALKPQRWYLTVKNLGPLVDTEQPMQKLRSISIKVIGEGETTGIESIGVTSTGRKAPDGIYDLQGRRLNGEPARGVYIKNGKKYVK